MDYLLQIFMAAFGAFGYAILFNARRNKLIISFIGGAITWIFYLLANSIFESILMCNIIGAMAATFYSIFMAKWKKAPVTCFLIPSVIPLIPGGALYHAMTALVNSNSVEFENYITITVLSALGISLGIMLTSILGGNHGIHRLRRKA